MSTLGKIYLAGICAFVRRYLDCRLHIACYFKSGCCQKLYNLRLPLHNRIMLVSGDYLPKISVITVCLNCDATIERTIKSVTAQTFSNIEYIIIDGGSEDHTLSIVDKYSANIDIILSEKDHGIYDAMNKGIQLSHGDYIYFLNSGDYFFSENTIQNVVDSTSLTGNFAFIYGDVIVYDDQTKEYKSCFCADEMDLMSGTIYHQGIFAKREIFKQYGLFRCQYGIYADFDWILRVVVQNARKIHHIRQPVAYYLKGGVSATQRKNHRFERYAVVAQYLTPKTMLRYAVSYPLAFPICLWYWTQIHYLK